MSTLGPWALARLNRPLFRVPNSIALLALIGNRWTLVAESVTGAGCDEGEPRADAGGGIRITDIRATHLTCADAVFDVGGWVANLQFGGCRSAARCRVVDRSSDILGLPCRLRRLHPARRHRYLARVTCTTPLQRLAFLLHNRA